MRWTILSLYRQAYSGLPRRAWLLALVQFVNRSGSMVLFFLTLYLTSRLGFTLARAGQVVGVYGFGALLGAWLGGVLCDRLGATAVQKLSLALGGLTLILLGYMRSFAAVAAAAFLAAAAASDEPPAAVASARPGVS